ETVRERQLRHSGRSTLVAVPDRRATSAGLVDVDALYSRRRGGTVHGRRGARVAEVVLNDDRATGAYQRVIRRTFAGSEHGNSAHEPAGGHPLGAAVHNNVHRVGV